MVRVHKTGASPVRLVAQAGSPSSLFFESIGLASHRALLVALARSANGRGAVGYAGNSAERAAS